MELLKNKSLSEKLEKELMRFEKKDDPFLFIIVGDLSMKNRYGETMLAVSA